MTKKLIINIVLALTTFLFLTGCTEPLALETNTFEDAIVVEATITNELKKQEIKITRTYKFESDGPIFESNAQVFIKDNLGNQYNFQETSDKYISENEFKALPNRNYTLHIITEDGKSYSSSNELLTTENNIQDIVPNVKTIEGVRGVELNVKSFDPTNTSKYYRYEYDETYKIIAPFWVMKEAIVTGPQSINIINRTSEARVCYSTEKSTKIIQTSTNDLTEDRVNFPVRFISNQNPIISHRYSILVKQYVQSLAAYTYYKTLNEISTNESILSQNQPGFLYGNIKSNSNPNEKVIGFFEVASVSEKRIFFNYIDLFPNEPLPPYFIKCEPFDLFFCFGPADHCNGYTIIESLTNKTITYHSGTNNDYTFVESPCGDCTRISSNIKPTFWID